MIGIEKGFWRGYGPLLLAIGASQLTQQADIVMVGRLGGGASGAYVMLTRLAIVDIVLMTAMGAVASTAVAEAQRNGETAPVAGRALGLAALAGVCCGVFGLSLYPHVAEWLTGEGETAALIADGVFWYTLAAPFRFFINTAVFVLHVLGHGASVVRWKLIEVGAKAAGNFLIMEFFGLGFPGCFASGFIIAIISATWCRRMLSPYNVQWLCVPGYSWTLQFLRSTAWESQRIVSAQLAVLTCLALFAAPWLGQNDGHRLNSYAAGQTLMLLVFAPLMALMRFLAFRLPKLDEGEFAPIVRTLWLHGAPITISVASILFVSRDVLGDLYGQRGPWWSTLIQALALSLPLRYATNVMRAVVQAQGAFGAVAAADSAAAWLFAVPLVASGLYVDAPVVAYLSLIVPEAACAAWLWRRLHPPRRHALVSARP